MKIWNLSIRQPVFITMVLLALVVLGTVSLTRMPVDLFPDVSFPIVSVITVYPGASPQEVEDQVTSVLEDALSSLPGVKKVTSRSSEGLSSVLVEFTLETPDEKAAQDVREQVDLVRNQLPDDAMDPIVQRFDPSAMPILTFSVADRSGRYSPAQLRKLVEDIVERPLERTPGVAAVEVKGGQVREIQVNLNLKALQARHIPPQQVVAALKMENLNIPGGTVTENDRELLVRTPGNFNSVDEIKNVVISWRGSPVYLRDVADVVDGFAKRDTITRLNGEEAIVVSVHKQSGTNTTAVAKRVKKQLDQILKANPELEIVIARDESIFVQQSVNDAVNDLLLGALLAGLVVLFFFRDLRNTIITLIGLPVIMLGTLFVLDLVLGYTLNMITLLALSLSVGLVIDDAIVVRENIFRWMEMGYSPREAASKATDEVALPVMAMTLTIVSVFLPVAYATGLVGRFFREFGITVAVAVLISMVEAFTLAPMLSAYFFKRHEDKPKKGGQPQDHQETATGWLTRIYTQALNWVMNHKGLVTVISVIVLTISMLSFSFIGRAFMPPMDQGQFDVEMRLPPGTPLQVTQEEAIRVESIIRNHPQVSDVFTTIGERGAPERAHFFVKLKGGPSAKAQPVMDELRAQLKGVPGLSFQSANAFSGGQTLLGNRDILIEVVSYTGDYDTLIAASNQLAARLAEIPGVVDVDNSYKPGKPEVRLEVDRQRAANFGLSTAQVGATIRTLINGEVASTFRGEGDEADIRVQLREEDRNSIDEILNMTLLSPSGRLVPLRNVARVSLGSGPTEIQRINRQPAITIGANYSGRSEADVMADVRKLLAEHPLPAGVEAKLTGRAELQEESFSSLSQALLLSLIFVYMVLASRFGSFIQPILIMLAMPLAVVGAILALVITGRPMDMTAMIGFIMLMGLVTKNSILLVDFANREQDRGADPDVAMRRAGPIRLRPILMTTFALILGMLPIALGLGAGGDFRAPMAIAVIGGLTTSMFLTLFIVPIAYVLLAGWQARVLGWWAARKAAREKVKAQVASAQAAGK